MQVRCPISRRDALAASALVLLLLSTCTEPLTGPLDSRRHTLPRLDAVTVFAPVIFTGAGDIASCNSTGDDSTAAILDTIPGLVFTAGDNEYESGTATEYANCYNPTWGRHLSRTYASIGNHEYETDTTATGTFDYFGSAIGPRGKAYYSFDQGAWHIVVLNVSGHYVPYGAGSEQEAWLRADLAANTQRCTLAIWHYPRFFSPVTADTTSLDNTQKVLWDDLYAAGADVVVNGHVHDYERFAPQSPDGTVDSTRGMTEFIVGTGGKGYSKTTAIRANSQVRYAGFGVMKFTLGDGSYSWQFIPTSGKFTDSGSGTCHNAAPNQLPTASVGGPYTGVTGTAVSFDGSGSSDPDNNTPLTYAWDFGDGRTGTGAKPLHAYAGSGSYTVTLVVTDARGGKSAPATTTATIADAPPPTTQVLVGAGNIARCGSSQLNDEATAALIGNIPGTVFTTGDHTWTDTSTTELVNCYDPSWGQLKARTRPAIGHKEYGVPGATPYFNYFGAVAGDPTKGYYSYDLGAWHVVVLNSISEVVPTKSGSAQELWLKADLAASTKTCTVAIWDRPRFFSPPSSTASGTRSEMYAIWQDLYAAGVELVVNGHQYTYERFAPQTADGVADAARGIREFIVGTGGQRHDPIALVQANSEVRDNTTYGVLKLTLGDGTYSWQFVPVPGGSFTDSGSGTCH